MTAHRSTPYCYQNDSCSRPSSGRSGHFSLKFSVLALAAALAGCAVGPTYERATVTTASANWKEAPAANGWLPAAPADALDRGEWWKLFNDATLDDLAGRVEVSNQNIAAAVASYAQAQALVRQQRAALFPQVSVGGSGRRSGALRSGDSGTAPTSDYSATLGVDWAPDVWGRLRNAVTSAQANAQASEADLAAARLSAIGEVAINYFSLRETDTELRLLNETIEGYERAYTITKNRYDAGIVAQTDVLQAQTQLISTRADRLTVQRTRATYEHAIAVLVGAAPADFSLPPAEWTPTVPGVPIAVPSTVLQRRPDIAAAERAMASANAQIGVARAAYYPSFSLSGSLGSSASRVGDLFSASNTLWALGLSVAQVVFDGGAIGAGVDVAKASYDTSVARYRQTVLTAFQGVEDQLTAGATLAQQEGLRREASLAADKTEQQLLNRYRSAQVNYTDVVTAQAAALSARRSLVQTQLNRQVSAVTLIQGLGGGWRAEWLTEPPAAGVQPQS